MNVIEEADTKKESTKFVTLVSLEGDKFELPLRAIKFSKLIETMVGYKENPEGDSDSEDDDSDYEDDKEIPLVEVKTKTVKKVIEFATHYQNQAMDKIPQVGFCVCIYFVWLNKRSIFCLAPQRHERLQ